MNILRCIAICGLLFLAACFVQSPFGQQLPEGDEGKEAERLIVLLQTPGIRDSDPDKVTEALRRLGEIRAEQAIPILAEYLDFKRPPTDHEKAGVKLAITAIPYPARVALDRIGKSATGELIKVIRKHGIKSVAGDNAFWVLHYYYRNYSEELLGLLELLDQEASSAPEEEAQRLREAIARYRELMEK